MSARTTSLRAAGLPEDLPPPASDELELGKGEVLLEGEDLVFFAYGSMVETSYHAALQLREKGIRVTVVDARFAKPNPLL